MTNARSRNKNEMNESNSLSLLKRPHIQQQQSKKKSPTNTFGASLFYVYNDTYSVKWTFGKIQEREKNSTNTKKTRCCSQLMTPFWVKILVYFHYVYPYFEVDCIAIYVSVSRLRSMPIPIAHKMENLLQNTSPSSISKWNLNSPGCMHGIVAISYEMWIQNTLSKLFYGKSVFDVGDHAQKRQPLRL